MSRSFSFSLFSSLAVSIIVGAFSWTATAVAEPLATEDLVLAERNGLVAVEAEHYFKQTKVDTRSWHLTHSDLTPEVTPDGDPNHVAGASGGGSDC